MHVEQTDLAGLLLIEPKCLRDARGFFLETFQRSRYSTVGIDEDFVQDNHSRSSYKMFCEACVFEIENPQAQIVTVIRGRISRRCRRSAAWFADLRPLVRRRIER